MDDARLQANFENIRTALANMADLIEETSRSLQAEMRTEMYAMEERLRADIDAVRVDIARIEASNARNTRMLLSGTLALGGLQKWAKQRDKLDTKRDARIADVQQRIRKVERHSKRRAG
jgi:hypothetical protein